MHQRPILFGFPTSNKAYRQRQCQEQLEGGIMRHACSISSLKITGDTRV